MYGVTTNPLLLAGVGKNPIDVLNALAQLNFKQIFYQLVSTTLKSMHQEAKFVSPIIGSPLVLKIPPTKVGFQFVGRFGNQLPCCVTAVYSPAQTLVAREPEPIT